MRVYFHNLRWLLLKAERFAAVLGLAASVAITLASTANDAAAPIKSDLGILTQRDDVYNLYHAAEHTQWRDVPGWFVGPWNYPGMGYYRPLTSILQLSEYRLFHGDFVAYCRVSWLLNAIAAGLLYLLTLSLLRHNRVAPLLGFVAAMKFATPAGAKYLSVGAVLSWWPAQNDPLSLMFALLGLLLLDHYLMRGGRGWVAGACAAIAAAVASKEMGYACFPAALALVWFRRGGIDRRPMALLTGFGVGLFLLRRLVVPNAYAPRILYGRAFIRALEELAMPITTLVGAHLWWAVAATACLTITVTVGLRRRWPVWVICLLCAALASLCALFSGDQAFFLSWMFDGVLPDPLLFVLATLLLWRYRRLEPGVVPVAAIAASAVAIMAYVGLHYHYWTGAFLGLADAVFLACLGRWAGELHGQLNWSLPLRGAAAKAQAIPEEAAAGG